MTMRRQVMFFLLFLPLAGCNDDQATGLQIPALMPGASATYTLEGSLAGFGMGLGQGMEESGRRIFPTSGTLHVTATPTQRIVPTGLVEPVTELAYAFEHQDGRPLFLGKQYLQPLAGVVGRVVDAQVNTNGNSSPVWVHGWSYTGPDLLLANVVGGHEWSAGSLSVFNPDLNKTTAFSTRIRSGILHLEQADPEGPGAFLGTWTSDCAFPSTFTHTFRSETVMHLERLACTQGAGAPILVQPIVPEPRNPLVKAINPQELWIGDSLSNGETSSGEAWSELRRSVSYASFCNPCDLVEVRVTQATKAAALPLLPTTTAHQWGFVLTTARDAKYFLVEYVEGEATVSDLGRIDRDPVENPMGLPATPVMETMSRVIGESPGVRIFTALPRDDSSGAYIRLSQGEWDQSRPPETRVDADFAWLATLGGYLASYPSPQAEL